MTVATCGKALPACMGGGLEIITACDLRLCGESARFCAPVGRLGFPLALGETETLFNLVGAAVAAELLIEGRILTAREAYEAGWRPASCPMRSSRRRSTRRGRTSWPAAQWLRACTSASCGD
jgi:1,4-dihydroxy-2-naphthoyl-CoA synthase